MAMLGFVLECAAIAAFVGGATSVLAAGAFLLGGGLSRAWPAARRADALFLLAVAPSLVTTALLAAAAAPSIASALGLAADHCASHDHHLHLCFLHSAGLKPALALIGAFALAAFAYRLLVLGSGLLSSRAQLGQLERLGQRRMGRFPVISVPGAPRLCHAVGILRRRVIVARELERALDPGELEAALAHEEAHLARRDPLALLVLGLAGLFALPPLHRFLVRRFQAAVEEACDAQSAVAVADPSLVAAALVKVASLQRGAGACPEGSPAFGERALERRVRLLLSETQLAVAPSRAIVIGSLAGALGLAVALSQTDALHHAVETALHFSF